MGSLIELREVTKRFGRVTAVAEVTLAVEQGEFVALLGPSGCGKTTTLNLIAGFLEPDAGSISLHGQVVHDQPPYRRNLGMVFQNYALFPHLTVAQNVAFGLEMRHMGRADIGKRVEEALALVRLVGYGARYPRELSGGQQQRVALARALVIQPTALLLDEPLSNLDAKLREEMRVELRDIQRRTGVTTVFVTHDQVEALAMADRVVVMNQGQIEQIGSPLDIYCAPATAFVAGFIGQVNQLPARVEGREQGALLVRAGEVLMRAGDRSGVSVGQQVLALVRPERIRVAPASGCANRFPATVKQVTFLGSVTTCAVDVQGQELKIQLQNTERPADFLPGSELVVGWDDASCLVIPV